MLARDGIILVKFWFSVSRTEQLRRFVRRQLNPVKRWKLSPVDLASLDKWDEYTRAKEAMFFYTDLADAPWTVVKSNDKKRARLEAMRYVLPRVAYQDKDERAVGRPDPLIVGPAPLLHEKGERGSLPPSRSRGCHSARSSRAAGVRPAIRPGTTATTLASARAPTVMKISVRPGTVGSGTITTFISRAFALPRVWLPTAIILEFMLDNGYGTASLWFSDGRDCVRANQWSAPLYWERRDGEWWHFTVDGMQPLPLNEPVCHFGFYEADAYSRWAGARLPTEFEWEVAADTCPGWGNLLESGLLHPRPVEAVEPVGSSSAPGGPTSPPPTSCPRTT